MNPPCNRAITSTLALLFVTVAPGCGPDDEQPDSDPIPQAGCSPDRPCQEGFACSEGGECIEELRGDNLQPCNADGSCNGELICVDEQICREPLAWGPCDPNELPPGYSMPDDLQCALVEVPHDWDAPDGNKLILRVAIHRSVRPARTGVFQLAGGPGGSSVAQSSIIESVLPDLRQQFDLVYVDQRGTGASGYMDCPSDDTKSGLIACADIYNPWGLDHYLTRDAARDLDHVRGRMGYPQIMLRGGSYGTRLGLEYARLFPERIRALVLDGTVSPDDDFFSSVILKVDRGVERLITDCAADASCQQQAPTLEADLQAMLTRALTDPRPIKIGGSSYVEDESLFKYAIKFLVEDWYWRFRMPKAIHNCNAGDCNGWNGLLSELLGTAVTSATSSLWGRSPSTARPWLRDVSVWGQSSYVSMGLYITVVCGDFRANGPSDQQLAELAAAQTFGDSTFMLELLEICPAWEVTPSDADQRKPVTSDVPTLFMSGAIDFVTPPEGGEKAAALFANGHHVVIPDATHSTMITPCGSQIINDFLYADGDFAQVDVSCIDSYGLEFH